MRPSHSTAKRGEPLAGETGRQLWNWWKVGHALGQRRYNINRVAVSQSRTRRARSREVEARASRGIEARASRGRG